MERLSQQEIKEYLLRNENWKLTDDRWIARKYRFRDYLRGIEFVKMITEASEEANHHPFISIDYKLVTVKITSWNAHGLTALDFQMAQEYDRCFEQFKHGSFNRS